MFWLKNKIFGHTKPKNLDSLTMKYPKFCYFQVRRYLLPPQNIPFFAYLHELEQVKKKVGRSQCTVQYEAIFHC